MIILDSLFTKGPTLSSQLALSNIFFVSNKRQLKRPLVAVRCHLRGVKVAEPALVEKAPPQPRGSCRQLPLETEHFRVEN